MNDTVIMTTQEAHEVVLRVLRDKWLEENGYKPQDLKQDADGRYFVSVSKKLCCHITSYYLEYLPEKICKYHSFL